MTEAVGKGDVRRYLILFIAGALLIPAGVLAGSIAVESRGGTSGCARRSAWLHDDVTRFAAAEGAAGAVDRFKKPDADLAGVAKAYAGAESEQRASNPPASDDASNQLIAKYFQMMSENWNGWVEHRFLSVHTIYDVTAVTDSLHEALLASQKRCG